MLNHVVEAFIWCTSILAYPAFYGTAGLLVLAGILVYVYQTRNDIWIH